MDWLLELDTKLFLFLNGLHSDSLDPIMLWVSGKVSWWPLYAALLGYLFYRKRLGGLIVLVTIIICVALTDQVSVHLFKEVFQRPRPCHEASLANQIYLVKGCGGAYGFVSSHASNVFGVATLLLLILKRRWLSVILISWAILVSYSRVYLGVHYPADIIGGALLGVSIGFGLFTWLRSLQQYLPHKWRFEEARQ